MSMKLKVKKVVDKQGHNKALLLHGDWIFIEIEDHPYVGLGEATHSGDDDKCVDLIFDYYNKYFENKDYSLNDINAFESQFTLSDVGRLRGTAISALSQAATDLLAKRNGIPLWNLFRNEYIRNSVPVYVTINRALSSRSFDDYRRIADRVLAEGITDFKCAPFNAVSNNSDQMRASEYGLSVLQMLSNEYPELRFRVDFHKRFSCTNFFKILPDIERLNPYWLEEPCEISNSYANIRSHSDIKLAAGELYFGSSPFQEIIDNGYADVIMPDIKHIGGTNTFFNVCKYGFENDVEISPHNPSGPICAYHSIQYAAIFQNVSSIEIPFEKLLENTLNYRSFIHNNKMEINHAYGIGISSLS